MAEDSGQASRGDKILELIAAVATGDANRRDVVAALKDRGVDTLDVLVEALVEVAQKSQQAPPEYLDPRRVAEAGGRPRSPEATHFNPGEPFILNGVLYDPADIDHFNDRDLHFIAGRPDLPLFATDDRALMTNWWQLLYLSAAGGYAVDLGQHAVPPGLSGLSGLSGVSAGPASALASSIVPHTNFYEHTVFSGDRLELGPGRAHTDLTKVNHGFLGLGGSWNDYISSVELVGTRNGTLWEHVNYGGNSISITYHRYDLPGGWNDRASCISAL